jgi:hypothetical protein
VGKEKGVQGLSTAFKGQGKEKREAAAVPMAMGAGGRIPKDWGGIKGN